MLQKIEEALGDGGASRDRALHMCLLWGLGKPAQQQRDGGHHTLTIAPRYALGVDPVAMRQQLEAEEQAKGLGAAPAKKEGVRQGVARPVGPRPMSALMKAANTLPRTVKDPENPDVDLEPVTDSDFPDDPSLDVHSEDVTR